MTFSALWTEHPEWHEIFSETDYLMTSVLERTSSSPLLSESAALLSLLLSKSLRMNHVALPLTPDELARLCEEQLWQREANEDDESRQKNRPDVEALLQGLDELLALGSTVVVVQDFVTPIEKLGSPLIVSEEHGIRKFLAYRRYAYAEEVVTAALLEAARQPDPLQATSADDVMSELARETLSDEGRLAVRRAIERKVSVITGGPGRGKTTVIASLLLGLRRVATLDGRTYSVALCAPTAKAAVRMEEAIKSQLASAGETWDDLMNFVRVDERSGSVHRLLGIRPDNTKSLRQMEHDLVLVDEVSMLDISLLAKVLEHAPKTHVVFVGDADQLASVNVGAALRDIIDGVEAAELTEVVTWLTQNFRFREEINQLAEAINSGSSDEALSIIDRYPEVFSHEDDAEKLISENLAWAEELRTLADAASEGGEQAREDVLDVLGKRAILCATRKGKGSVAWWREALSRRLEVNGATTTRFQVGMPVLITENEQSTVLNSEAKLSNGDLGVAVADGGNMTVVFGPNKAPRVKRESEIGAADVAWSMTIHKSQGSEYETVVVSLPKAGSRILTRELLYTAVTRARERVVIVGSHEAITRAIERETFRASSIVDRLRMRAAAPSNA